MIMYTKEGVEVKVVREIEGGYLARIVYTTYDWEEEEESECEEVDGEPIIFYEKLFTVAPSEKYSQEIVDLKNQYNLLSKELDDIRQIKASESGLLNQISKHTILSYLSKILTGDYTHICFLRTIEIVDKNRIYLPNELGVEWTIAYGWAIIKRNRDYHEYQYDNPMLVFDSLASAIDYGKQLAITKINKFDYSRDWVSLSDFEKTFSEIENKDVKNDPSVIAAYDAMKEKVKEKASLVAQKRINEKIQELEKQKTELEKLKN